MYSNTKNFNLEGELFLPNKTLSLTGKFILRNGDFIDGGMSNGFDARDTIQGILLNTSTYCFPGAENNPRNILMFSHFGNSLYNHFFHLVSSGMDFNGEYIGKFDDEKSEAMGVNQLHFSDSARYIDMLINNKDNADVKITLKEN